MLTRKLILTLSVLALSITAYTAALYRKTTGTKAERGVAIAAADRWHIKGALSEACTCNVPCSCNFGEGPSPHSYCHVVYAYDIREGHFNGTRLDGLRFGAIEGASGKGIYLDVRATNEQRSALEALARKVMRVNGDRVGNNKLLGIKWVQIKQEYDDRHDQLDLGGAGSFKTNFIMGKDKTKPVVVLNNTEWAIPAAIKGKTEYFRISDQYGNKESTRGTNSNHGDFDYDENSQISDLSCGSSCDSRAPGEAHTHRMSKSRR